MAGCGRDHAEHCFQHQHHIRPGLVSFERCVIAKLAILLLLRRTSGPEARISMVCATSSRTSVILSGSS
jgi:hypothetical protein